MRLSLLAAALLPLLASADYNPIPLTSTATATATLTLTSTSTLTRTITVSEVITSVYATYPIHNTTTTSTYGPSVVSNYVVAPTGASTGYSSAGAPPGASASLPVSYLGAASSLSVSWAGVGAVVCVVAALL